MLPAAIHISSGAMERPVALIHGAFSSPAFWRGPLPESIKGRAAIAYALPAHGPWMLDDARLDGVLRVERLARLYALALKRDFGGRPATLVGHSTGAFVALAVAAKAPELVSGLVLSGVFAAGERLAGRCLLRRLVSHPVLGPIAFDLAFRAWTSSATAFVQGLSSLMASPSSGLDAPYLAVCEDVRSDLLRSRPRGLHRFAAWLQKANIETALSRVTQPALVISGADDQVVPADEQRLVAKLLPRADYIEISDCGHLAMAEKPSAFCDFTNDWLRQHEKSVYAGAAWA